MSMSNLRVDRAQSMRTAAVKAELEWLSGELDPARNVDVFLWPKLT